MSNFKFLREMPSSLNDACRSMEVAADHIDALEHVLLDARNAIASLPKEALGYANDPNGIPVSWPIQAELIWHINLALEGKKAADMTAASPSDAI
jgi:hypothetical protein